VDPHVTSRSSQLIAPPAYIYLLSFIQVRPSLVGWLVHNSVDQTSLIFPAVLGTSHQLTPVAMDRPTRIGCRTLTPALAAITPVTVGKSEPPACARTKMKPVEFF